MAALFRPTRVSTAHAPHPGCLHFGSGICRKRKHACLRAHACCQLWAADACVAEAWARGCRKRGPVPWTLMWCAEGGSVPLRRRRMSRAPLAALPTPDRLPVPGLTSDQFQNLKQPRLIQVFGQKHRLIKLCQWRKKWIRSRFSRFKTVAAFNLLTAKLSNVSTCYPIFTIYLNDISKVGWNRRISKNVSAPAAQGLKRWHVMLGVVVLRVRLNGLREL